jgi:methyltransferase (TIGR00027 family)
MRERSAALVFYLLSLLLLPVSVMGYVLWLASAYRRRAPGVSTTAQGPLSARWFEHLLGTRSDEPARRLMEVLPGVSPLARELAAGPLVLAHRATGYVPRAFRYPFDGEVPPLYQASARIPFFDAAIERYVGTAGQLVILGAGFDTRAYRLPSGSALRSFEVDTPATQAVKRAMLAKARIDASRVTFVAADFETEDWLAKLVAAGFRPDEPALFLWEGVTPYLDRDAIEDTLRTIAGTARGSAVAFDYFTTEPLRSRGLYWRYGRMMTRAAGEPIKFGVDSTPPSREQLAALLRSCGLALVEQRTLGRETAGERAWGGFALAVVE